MSILAAAGLKVAGGLFRGRSKRKAAKQEKRAAREGYAIAQENIGKQREQNVETERRAGRDVRAVEGEAALRSGATGAAQNNQNTNTVIGGLMNENARQLDWLRTTNASTIDSMEREAQYNLSRGIASANATRTSAFGDIIGAAGSALELFPSTPKVAPNPFEKGKRTGSFTRPAPQFGRIA